MCGLPAYQRRRRLFQLHANDSKTHQGAVVGGKGCLGAATSQDRAAAASALRQAQLEADGCTPANPNTTAYLPRLYIQSYT